MAWSVTVAAINSFRFLKRLPDGIWVFLSATFARLLSLGSERLWFDEAFTFWVAAPSTDFWAAVKGDTHPPLWNLIQAFQVRLMSMLHLDLEVSFRLWSVVFSVGAVMLLWLIARKLSFSRTTALSIGLLAAFMPGLVYFGQDARMYSLLSFGVMGALYAALRRNWYLFTPFTLATLYTQNVGLFYIAALGLAALLTSECAEERLRIVLSLTVVALLYLPWLPSMLQQASAVGESYWVVPVNVLNALQPFALLTVGARYHDAFALHLLVVVYGLLFVGLWVSRRWLLSRQGGIVLAVLLGGPALLAGLSLVFRSVYVFRALLPSGFVLMLVWGYALTHLHLRVRKVALLVSVPMLLLSMLSYYLPAKANREDVVVWLQPLTEGWQTGDVLWHTDAVTAVTYQTYLPGKPFFIRPAIGDVIHITEAVRDAFHLERRAFDQLRGEYQRVWVVMERTPYTPQAEIDALEGILADYPHVLIRQTVYHRFTTNLLYLVSFDDHHR